MTRCWLNLRLTAKKKLNGTEKVEMATIHMEEDVVLLFMAQKVLFLWIEDTTNFLIEEES